MKKFLKWTGILLGILILLIIAVILGVFIRYDRYGFYPSGGPLSDNQAGYDVNYYELNLEILPEDQALRGNVVIKLHALNTLDKIELDLIDNFDVSKVEDGNHNALSFQHDDDKLWVTPVSTLNPAQMLSVIVHYEGQPIEAIFPPWIGGFNWSKDKNGRDWIGVSCQGEGGKIWFPCKAHTSDEPDSAALNITVADSLFCAANGLLQGVGQPVEGKKTYHWKTRYPINNYNLNISIGNYETLQTSYVTQKGDTMPVYYYVLPQSREGAEAHLAMALDMLYTYRKFYGEYPFNKEKFAIVETDYLGMEHQTINAYGNKYHYRTVDNIEYDELMLHEMGHEWWGNKVTVRDLADMWIQEGICTYGEALYLEAKGGQKAYRDHMEEKAARISNNKPIIPKKDAKADESYQGDIYTKGAWLMHSLRFLLGDSLFFEILYQFCNDSAYTYQNLVGTDDFINLLKKKGAGEWEPFIRSYLTTTQLPDFAVDSLGQNEYGLRLINVDYQLPVQVQADDSLYVVKLGKEAVNIKSAERPQIDPNHWFLKASELLKE